MIGGEIPPELSANQDAQTAKLALLLLETGILPERYWRRSRKNLQSACQRALTEWLNESLSGLQCIRPTFRLSIGKRDVDVHRPGENEDAMLRIDWYAIDADAHVIGPAIEHVERHHPGLGKVVIRELGRASWQSFPIFMCDDQLSIASWVMWGGCENEQEYMEQMDDEEAKGYLADIIPYTEIVSKAPGWLFGYGAAWKMKDSGLKRICKNTKDELSAEIAKTVIALRMLPLPEDDFHEEAREQGEDFVGFSAVTQWCEDDYAIAVMDRFCHYAYEGGVGYEYCGTHSQLIGDVDAFLEWMKKMQRLFAVTKLVDHLLYLLSGRDSPYRSKWSKEK